MLRIHLVEAKNLMKMDIGMLGKGKSDPYAIITVGAQQFKTDVINNTVNPKWDFWCEVSWFHIQKLLFFPLPSFTFLYLRENSKIFFSGNDLKRDFSHKFDKN